MTRLACHLLLCLGLLLTQQAWSLSQMPMATHAGLPTDTTDVSAACPHHDPESPAALAQADTAGTCHDGGGACHCAHASGSNLPTGLHVTATLPPSSTEPTLSARPVPASPTETPWRPPA